MRSDEIAEDAGTRNTVDAQFGHTLDETELLQRMQRDVLDTNAARLRLLLGIVVDPWKSGAGDAVVVGGAGRLAESATLSAASSTTGSCGGKARSMAVGQEMAIRIAWGCSKAQCDCTGQYYHWTGKWRPRLRTVI